MNVAYILLFIFASTSYISTMQIYIPVLDTLMIPNGYRAALLNFCSFIIIVFIFFNSTKKIEIIDNLKKILITWIPWVIYLLLRVDYNDYLSIQKFVRIILHQFFTIMWFFIAYTNNPKYFTKYFLATSFSLSFFILCVFCFSHDVYMVMNDNYI